MMKGFLAVARREFQEMRFVSPAALAASLVPFAIPLVRGMHGAAAAEVREWTAFVPAVMFAAGLAAALGATTLAGELANRRLGFYFSRPISGPALWAGKLGAACVMAFGVAALIYAPTLVAAGGRTVLFDHPAQAFELFGAVAVAGVLVFHAAVIALRPRTPLLALDVTALVLLGLAIAALRQRFVLAFATEALRRAETVFGVAAVAALVAAGLFAITRGRSDGQAAHRVLSATLWSILAVTMATTSAYASWVFSVAPENLTGIDWVVPTARGSWIEIHGTARGWSPTFLYDTATGRYHGAGASPWMGPALSHDGTRAAWFEAAAQGGPYDVVTWKLDDARARPATMFSLPSIPYSTFLSDHGERLAAISNGVLSVWDSSTGVSLGSARVAGDRAGVHSFFVDPNRIRIFRFKNSWEGVEENRLDILEFDLSKKTLSTIVTIEDAIFCLSDETGDRLLVTGKGRVALHDGHTGAPIVALTPRSPQRRTSGRFTSDGRIVLAVTEGSLPGGSSLESSRQAAHLEVFTRDGRLERTLDIPGHQHATLGGEVTPGRLVVGTSSGSPSGPNRVLYLTNLATGELKQVAEGLSPIRTLSETGSEATRLFFGPGHSLVHFDPLTGERRVLLGKR